MGMPYHILDCISAISGANISPLLAFALTGPFSFVFLTLHFLHCFPFLPSVLWRCWLGGRKGIWPVKTEWWGAGMVVCLERGADLHTAQLMPLQLTVSCFSKIQISLCVCVCVFHSVFCSFFPSPCSWNSAEGLWSLFRCYGQLAEHLTDIGYCCSQEWCL